MTDREKLIKELRWWADGCDRTNSGCQVRPLLERAADELANGVVVREKGEWIYDYWCEFKCSECGALSKTEPRGGENFCPNCGADMRKGENG